jgi:hypothetical protein
MSIAHSLLLAGEIVSGTIVGLIFLSIAMASIRALADGAVEKFVPSIDIAKAEVKASQECYLHRVLVAFDIFMNVVFWIGFENETISAHSYRAATEGKLWGRLMNWWLDGIQPNHGQKAASGDLERSISEVSRLKKLLGIS